FNPGFNDAIGTWYPPDVVSTDDAAWVVWSDTRGGDQSKTYQDVYLRRMLPAGSDIPPSGSEEARPRALALVARAGPRRAAAAGQLGRVHQPGLQGGGRVERRVELGGGDVEGVRTEHRFSGVELDAAEPAWVADAQRAVLRRSEVEREPVPPLQLTVAGVDQ